MKQQYILKTKTSVARLKRKLKLKLKGEEYEDDKHNR